MALNFNNLPKERPNSTTVFADGTYPTFVKKAELKVAGTDGSTYMQLMTVCTNPETKETNNVVDNFYTSDKPLNHYKLRQFLIAINCIPKGDFELRDLVKIIVGKKYLVALKTEQNQGYAPRNVVNVFDDEIYYPITGVDGSALPFKFDAPDTELPDATRDESY